MMVPGSLCLLKFSLGYFLDIVGLYYLILSIFTSSVHVGFYHLSTA